MSHLILKTALQHLSYSVPFDGNRNGDLREVKQFAQDKRSQDWDGLDALVLVTKHGINMTKVTR